VDLHDVGVTCDFEDLNLLEDLEVLFPDHVFVLDNFERYRLICLFLFAFKDLAKLTLVYLQPHYVVFVHFLVFRVLHHLLVPLLLRLLAQEVEGAERLLGEPEGNGVHLHFALKTHFGLAQLNLDVVETLDSRQSCALLVRVAEDVGAVNDCVVRPEEIGLVSFAAQVTLRLKQNFLPLKWGADQLLPDHAGIQDQVRIEISRLLLEAAFR